MKYFYNDMSNIKLSNLFGFALPQIYCHRTTLKPVLPYKHEGNTVYPTGHWIGVYFELKKVENLGYKITLIKGYEFSKINLFSKYIDQKKKLLL
jgi:DNA polymerase type B, organellar and viral